MPIKNSYIPYGRYWSTPFCRWQGSFAQTHSIKLAAAVGKKFLADAELSPKTFDSLVLGFTVPQKQSFYGAPWFAGMLGAPGITGPNVSQACATSVRALATAVCQLEAGMGEAILAVTCDRTSNGPHVYYPNPKGIGGMGDTDNPVWDNFNKDPYAGGPMIQTAENVAKEAGIAKKEQDDLTALRYQQYQEALADDRAFQRRYMVPVEIKLGRKKTVMVEGDEGIYATTLEGLSRLKPVLPDGSVSFGTQTFPGDGNAGMIVCSAERASELSKDSKVTISVSGFGEARVKAGFMPMAVVPAARKALASANIGVGDLQAIKTHNPFAINDVYFCRELGIEPERVNRFGSPLIWGHPQAPTGMRAMIELIEQLVLEGGGYGLFSGCAAGDTAMAVVLKVG